VCEHFDLQAFAFCFFGQGFPIVDVGLGFDATHHDFLIAKGITRDSVVGLAPQLDGEWRDVHGDSNARVVGIDVWQMLAFGKLGGDAGSLTCCEQQKRYEV
jgi:hypothetical protein